MLQLETAGNWFAVFAIFAWPLVSIILYRTRSPAEATIWTILGGLLLLPSGFSVKVPMIPAFDKNFVPSLCALVGCIVVAPRRKSSSPAFGLIEIVALVLVFGPVITSSFNNDIVVIGDRVLPGVGYYDGVSALLGQLIIFLPFLLGRRVLRESSCPEAVIRCLVIAGLFYSVPMLGEIRVSPQISNWVYGFFPSTYSTEMRYGGFRPVVFMKNGLTAAFFMMTTFLAAMAMWRVNDRIKLLPASVTPAYLGVIVFLCKSGGALVYALVGGFFIRWIKPKAQLRLAVVLACIGLLYPVLRITDTFPDKLLVDAAASIDQGRAGSLKFRFDQEQSLLAHAYERFLFGWGRYGRNRVYEESGKDSSITDGEWITTLGQFGMVGFLAQFGLLALSVFRGVSVFKFIRTERERIFFSTMALIVALGIVEQLPNASISSWSWLLAGALLGRAEQISKLARKTISATSRMRAHDAGSGPASTGGHASDNGQDSLIRQ